jgi:serine protease AprX
MVGSSAPIDDSKLMSSYVRTVGADRVWNEGPAYLQGQGMTVAVVDSGDCQRPLLRRPCNDVMDSKAGDSRVNMNVTVLYGQNGRVGGPDIYGHGSLVEGVIGGNGLGSAGKYMGIAPSVNLVSVKVSDDEGKALASNVVSGLQWVLDNKVTYNIRVVNLSLNTSEPESYQTSPIDAACEILWFNGIVVVVSAGNNGSTALYPPANDPFVITVGAMDDQGTPSLADDSVASFSAYGTDETGAVKPELVAPGKNLVSIVPKSPLTRIKKLHPSNFVGEGASDEYYMRVSGTSFSAPVVSGAVALLLQDEPTLTPDQVKYRLMATANRTWPGYDATTAGAGYLDAYEAVHGTSTESANTGTPASQLLFTGGDPISWDSVGWNSVGWNSVGWNSVGWNSVGWNSVGWNSDYWGP